MDSHVISSIEALEAVYKPRPSDASMVKESTVVTDEYKRLIEASPFVALASSGRRRSIVLHAVTEKGLFASRTNER